MGLPEFLAILLDKSINLFHVIIKVAEAIMDLGSSQVGISAQDTFNSPIKTVLTDDVTNCDVGASHVRFGA